MKRPVKQPIVGPRGVTRRPTEKPVSTGLIRRWLGRLFGAVLLAGVATLLVQGAMTLTAKPVAEVKIEGEFSFITKEDVAAKIYQSLDDSFIKADLKRMQTELLQEPWIDAVNVSRRWPDVLVVRVIEQQPIARWGSDGFLNLRGQIVRPHSLAGLQHLPLLSGPDVYSTELMQRYQVLAKLLRQHGLHVQEVTLDESLSWKLVLDDGLELMIGRDQIMEKISRFLIVYEAQLKTRRQELAKIDVRYSNGVAVSWKTAA